jgi:hypothetical protein
MHVASQRIFALLLPPVNLDCPPLESVLFIGTRFSNLYTAVDTILLPPARTAVIPL